MSYSLYIVATPIGNLADISHRALEILTSVDLILAEDTRHSKKLLMHYGISTPMKALHDHNESQSLSYLTEQLQTKNMALISDAGTPLISDPGYKLVRHLREQGIPVIPIPGASAIIAALSVSGLPTDRFSFEGFLPSSEQAREKKLQGLDNETRTMVFYESPKRVVKAVAAMVDVFGGQRLACVARELTKMNEAVHTASLEELSAGLLSGEIVSRGEFVLLVTGKDKAQAVDEKEVVRVLVLLLDDVSQKQAVILTSKITGMAKNAVYKIALDLPKNQ